MNIWPRTTFVSSLFTVIGLVLSLKKHRNWLLLSTLAGFLLLLYAQHHRCTLPAARRRGTHTEEEFGTAAATISQLQKKFADNQQQHPHQIKEDPGI